MRKKSFLFIIIAYFMINILFINNVYAIDIGSSGAFEEHGEGWNCTGSLHGSCPIGNIGIRIHLVDNNGVSVSDKSLIILNDGYNMLLSSFQNYNMIHLGSININNSRNRNGYYISNQFVDAIHNNNIKDAYSFINTWVYDEGNLNELKSYISYMKYGTFDNISQVEKDIYDNAHIMVENITGITFKVGKFGVNKRENVIGTPAQLSKYFRDNLQSYQWYFNNELGTQHGILGSKYYYNLDNNNIWAYNIYLPNNKIGLFGVKSANYGGINFRSGYPCIGNDPVCFFTKLNNDIQNGYGYSVGMVNLSDILKQTCDYYNTSHFAYNRGETNSPSGPNGIDCCTYFKDNSNRIPSGAELWYDHPECFYETPKEENLYATCKPNNKNQTTIRVKDNNPWETIAASIYHGSQNGSYGKYVKKQINNNCRLLCYEDITIDFPNPYKSTVEAGGHFIWPSIDNNNYKLKVTSDVKCKLFVTTDISHDDIQTCKDKASEELEKYNLSGNFTMSYNTKGKEKKYNANNKHLKLYSRTNSTFKANDISSIQNDRISLREAVIGFTQTAYYTTPDYYLYRYDDNYSNIPKFNYIKLNEGVIPNSLKKGDKENVTINYSSVGGFDNKVNLSPHNYTCEYNIGDGPTTPYCPPEYKYGGMDLSIALKRCPNLTKADALKYICDGTKVDEDLTCEKVYVDTGLSPDYPTKVVGIKITIEECGIKDKNQIIYTSNLAKACFSDTTKLPVCPVGTDREGQNTKNDGSPMTTKCLGDSECVNTGCNDNIRYCADGTDFAGELLSKFQDKINYYMQLGLSQSEAEEKACNNNSEKIVYRTISLDNPFPAKDGKGRNPGMNWYGKRFFDKGIIFNGKLLSRNETVVGNSLYTDKNIKPMYTIKLTPKIIKQIRAYNKSHKYDDNSTITCFNNGNSNHSGCQSDFLHNPLKYGVNNLITDGTCNKFFKTLEDFNKCANKN